MYFAENNLFKSISNCQNAKHSNCMNHNHNHEIEKNNEKTPNKSILIYQQ